MLPTLTWLQRESWIALLLQQGLDLTAILLLASYRGCAEGVLSRSEQNVGSMTGCIPHGQE